MNIERFHAIARALAEELEHGRVVALLEQHLRQPGREKRLYRRDDEDDDVPAANGDVLDRLWGAIIDPAGGPLPRFGKEGVIGL